MPVIALALGGAAIGLGVGYAAGLTTFAALATAASIGFSIGAIAGNLLFPTTSKSEQEGSRLNDLKVTSSSFGIVQPIVYGQVRIAGNIIWSTPIQEQKTTTTTRQGKGGGGPSATNTQTSYSYFGTFAVAFCEGPIEKVQRIWADSKLIWDTSSEPFENAPDSPDTRGSRDHVSSRGLFSKGGTSVTSNTSGASGKFRMRFYPGDEEQMPDSIIQDDKGAENVPAYRGTCYIVFDQMALADYGNRLPNITVELIKKSSPVFPYQILTQPRNPDTIFGENSVPMDAIAVDFDRALIYAQGQNPYGLIVMDAVTLRTIREVPMTEVLADGSDGQYTIGNLGPGIVIGSDGSLYFQTTHSGFGNSDIIRVDQNTLKETAAFHTTGGFSNTDHSLASPTFAAMLSAFVGGRRLDYYVTLGFWQQWGVLTMPDLLHVAHGTVDFSGYANVGFPGGCTQGKWGVGFGEVWGVWHMGAFGGPNVWLTKIRLEAGKFTCTTAAAFTVDQFTSDPDVTFVGFSAGQVLVYDASDDSVMLTFTIQGSIAGPFQAWAVKWSEASGIIWKTDISAVMNSHIGPSADVSGQSRTSGGTMAWYTVGGLVQIDLATGRILINQTAAPAVGGWPIGLLNSAQIYDSETQIVAGNFNEHLSGTSVPGDTAKAFIGRTSGMPTTLGEIVTDQCQRAGFEPADFDATTLTDEVQGYVISQRATVIDILTPLISSYLVDAVEIDYALKFAHRGRAIMATVPQDKLVRSDQRGGEPYVETRQQEIELPMRITVSYTDKDRDYQTNTQMAKRIRNPDPTVFSDNQVDLQMALMTTATPVKQLAEKLLYSTWNERHTFATKFSPEFDYLDPGDAVTLTLNDGYTARMRLAATTMGLDYSLDTKLIGETDGQYISTAEADPGVPWIGSHFIQAGSKSELVLLDTPLLRDADDLGGRAMRVYWGGGPFYRLAPWPGAVLMQATVETLLFDVIDSAANDMSWGYVDTPPADWQPIFATQDEEHGGVLYVGIIGGSFIPSSCTDEDMANGANPLALIAPNGQVEVIQYRDAQAQADGGWRLSTLRRGQRGTDTMADGHVIGEHFMFLGETLLEGLALPLSQRNVPEAYRLVTIGMVPEDAAIVPFTFHGRDMMPYAPVNAVRTHVGSDGVMTWQRRTRIGGLIEDGTDTVPLSEVTEAYEVYLMRTEADAVGFDPTNPATYMRAFLGLTAPTLTYTAAMMAADGFTPATDTVYAAIYQLSAVVGRGFSSLHVLPPLGGLTIGLEDGTGGWAGWLWG